LGALFQREELLDLVVWAESSLKAADIPEMITLPNGSRAYVGTKELAGALLRSLDNEAAVCERIDVVVLAGTGGWGPTPLTMVEWTRQFAFAWFEKIQEFLCDEDQLKQVGRTTDVSCKAAATGLAAWIVPALGITNPMAIGLAAAILLVLASTGHQAFCTMSKKEVLTELERLKK
jgi:hypothetical protein